MREIKFRAWVDGEKMINDVGNNLGYYLGTKDSCELMQYTGLKDKNGKEIYEGDIIDNGEGMELTIVEYVEDMFHLKSTKYPNLSKGNYRLATYVGLGCEIIGNIYENPELLSGVKKEGK